MSDEIKNTENERPKVAESAGALPESELEQVTGGTTAAPKLFEALSTGKHIKKVTIEL